MEVISLLTVALMVLGLLNAGVKRAERHVKDFIVCLLVILLMGWVTSTIMGKVMSFDFMEVLINGALAYIVGLAVGYVREKV